MTSDILDLLIAGRERIVKGWTKGRYTREVCGNKCVCALGAIGYGGAQDSSERMGAVEGAARSLVRHLPWEFRSQLEPWQLGGVWLVPKFNDEHATKDDILALYDRAIAAERERING